MSTKTLDAGSTFGPIDSKEGAWTRIIGFMDTMRRGMTMAADYKDMVARGVAPETASRVVLDRFGKR